MRLKFEPSPDSFTRKSVFAGVVILILSNILLNIVWYTFSQYKVDVREQNEQLATRLAFFELMFANTIESFHSEVFPLPSCNDVDSGIQE